MLKNEKFFCPLCLTHIENEFAFEHVLNHSNYYPYVCGHKNCSVEYSTERLLNLHCRMKHEGIENKLIHSEKRRDEIAKWIIQACFGSTDTRKMSTKLTIAKDNFQIRAKGTKANQGIDSLFPGVKNEFLVTIEPFMIEAVENYFADVKLERISIDIQFRKRKGQLIQACSECGRFIGPRNEIVHVIRHLMDKNEIDHVFACCLCERFSLRKGIIIKHLAFSHKVEDPTPNVHYLDNSEKYSNLIQEKKLACFPVLQTPAVPLTKDMNTPEFSLQLLENPKLFIKNELQLMQRSNYPKQTESRYTCLKCCRTISWNNKGNHVLKHMFEENAVDYMFACILCGEKVSLKFHVFNHLKLTHKVDTPIVDVHYFDNSVKYKHLVQQNIISCFTHTETSTTCQKEEKNASFTDAKMPIFCPKVEKPLESDCQKINNILDSMPVVTVIEPSVTQVTSVPAFAARKIKCQVCNTDVSLDKRYRNVHLLQHLRQKKILEYVVECLMCAPECQKRVSLSLKSLLGEHLRRVHRIHSSYGTRAQENVHYLNHIKKYQKLMLAEEQRCFPFINVTDVMRIKRKYVRKKNSVVEFSKPAIVNTTNVTPIKRELVRKQNLAVEFSKQGGVAATNVMPIKREYVWKKNLAVAVHNQGHANETDVMSSKRKYVRKQKLAVTTEDIRKQNRLSHKRQNEAEKFRRVECDVCKRFVGDNLSSKVTHVLKHLQDEKKLQYVFECLICGLKKGYAGLCKNEMLYKHIKRVHNIWPAEENVHYANNMKKYRRLFLIKDKLCFPFTEHRKHYFSVSKRRSYTRRSL